MTNYLTYFSNWDLTDFRNLEKDMENSDHMNQIWETSKIELIFKNKGIESEVDWESKVSCQKPLPIGLYRFILDN